MEQRIEYFSRRQYLDTYDTLFRVQFFQQYRKLAHQHEFYELAMVLSGTADHCLNGRTIPLAAGCVFVIPPGVVHWYDNMRKLYLANVLLMPEALVFDPDEFHELAGFHRLFGLPPDDAAMAPMPHHQQLSAAQLTEAGNLLNRIIAEHARKSPGYRMAARTLFLEFVIFLSRCGDSDMLETSNRTLLLGQMLKYINLHYAADISREDIFGAVGLPLRTGNRLFAELLQSTPIRELFKIRIQHASELLATSTLPVAEIAFRTGFRDSNYFSFCFRRVVGRSPRAFRTDSAG